MYSLSFTYKIKKDVSTSILLATVIFIYIKHLPPILATDENVNSWLFIS